MKYRLIDGEIILSGMTPEEYEVIKGWQLLKYDRKIGALVGPISLDLLMKLNDFRGRLPDELREIAIKLWSRQKLVEAARKDSSPQLLEKPLLKSNIKLFKHQIRAVNMALLNFGYDIDGGRFDDEN